MKRFTVLVDTPEKRRYTYSFQADDWDEAHAMAIVLYEVQHNSPVPEGTTFTDQGNL